MQAQLNISKNLLPKIPQFWESAGTALAELVQNALRAGASEIHLTIDAVTGTLTIRDNGCGIQSLEDFLTIGESDWEKEVVEPAGMGFYAHFGYSQQTVAESRDIRYTFTPECLRGAPVQIKPCKPSTWTVIQIEGIASQVLCEIDFARMRPLPAPDEELLFTLNGETLPNPLNGMIPLKTPVGVVYLSTLNTPMLMPRGIWEGLPVGYTYLKSQTLYGYSKDYLWSVDPSCGVRPRLPGREGFIENPAFTESQQHIQEAIEAYCQTRVAAVPLQALPEVPDWRLQNLTEALDVFGITERVVIAWVKDHLYHPTSIFEDTWQLNEYGFPEYPEIGSVRVRNDRVIRFRTDSEDTNREGLEVLLNQQAGCWPGWNSPPGETREVRTFAFDEAGEEIHFTNLRPRGTGFLAEALHIGERSILTNGAMFYRNEGPIWIGDLQDILPRADDLLDLWALANYYTEEGAWVEWVGENNAFDLARLQRTLADWFELGEDVNLYNWLLQVRISMVGWNGIPEHYRPIFQAALDDAEKQVVILGYQMAS